MPDEIHLLPEPQRIERLDGRVPLAKDPPPIAEHLARQSINTKLDLPQQGYELVIDAQGPQIRARDAEGLRYALQTLEQILAQSKRELPCLRIRDWPDFPVRGYMLDISRDRVPTQASLRELVGQLARLRINQLQLYTEHTFAYAAHETVWHDASPMTPPQIRELDTWCREHGIELVANQNSFGHMQRWLKQAPYRHLAELAQDNPAQTPPRDLAPNEASLAFMRSLYDELLPCFHSRTLNIGCDETFELGQGRSALACREHGRGRVYLDYLLGLVRDLHTRGWSVQFWGDIVRQYPELVGELPREGLIALVWGYEAPRDPDELPQVVRETLQRFGVPPESLRGFEWRARPFVEAEVPFYVCPGTSSWNSLIGRWPNARANLLDAAQAGRAHGARGYLITDWGDNGHLQPPALSLPPLVYGSAVAWCARANEDLDLGARLPEFLTGDPSGTLAMALIHLGKLHTTTQLQMLNGNALSTALLGRLDQPLLAWGETSADLLDALVQALDAERSRLAGLETTGETAALLCRELRQAALLARHGAWRIAHMRFGSGPSWEHMRADLEALIEEQQQVWRLRSRPGGLSDSIGRLKRLYDEYRSRAQEV